MQMKNKENNKEIVLAGYSSGKLAKSQEKLRDWLNNSQLYYKESLKDFKKNHCYFYWFV